MSRIRSIGEVISQKYPESQFVPQDGCAVSFDDFKNALGLAAKKYTDFQIDKMRVSLDRFADLFFDDWLSKRNER